MKAAEPHTTPAMMSEAPEMYLVRLGRGWRQGSRGEGSGRRREQGAYGEHGTGEPWGLCSNA